MNKPKNDSAQSMMHGSYSRFGAMIASSTLVMLALMYLNTQALIEELENQPDATGS